MKIESLREVKAKLSKIVKELPSKRSVVITKNGRPCAVLLPVTEETDLESMLRADDPGVANAGAPDYVEHGLGGSLFAATGTALGWRSDNTYWTLGLPFAFPFYDASYTSVTVSSEGLLQFAGSGSPWDPTNSAGELLTSRRIAPLWDDLRTNGAGDDIFVDTTVAGQVTIRWDATNAADASDVDFSVTLFADGTIRFDYGPGNTNLTPTVGISAGNGRVGPLPAYDGAGALGGVDSVEFRLEPAFVDLGAFEFGGSSLDVTPPTVEGTVIRRGTPEAPLTQIDVVFSEPVDPIDALAPANYELREAGADGAFDTEDDVLYALAPAYSPGSTRVVLDVVVPGGGLLPEGNYRFRVSGSTSIHDLSGNRLDGDRDGIEGGDSIAANQTPVLAPIGDQPGLENELLTFTATATDPDAGVLTFSLDPGAPAGAVIDGVTGVFTWTPDEVQSPGVYHVTVRVSDDGTPVLEDAETVTVVVGGVSSRTGAARFTASTFPALSSL